MTPVFVGSAFKNKGVQPLLDGVVDYLPSPLDVPPVEGKTLDGEPVVREADENGPLSALAFKVQSDPHVGKLTYMRVYSGTLNAGSYVMNTTKGRRERVGRLLQLHANSREQRDEVYAGELGAAVGGSQTGSGAPVGCRRGARRAGGGARRSRRASWWRRSVSRRPGPATRWFLPMANRSCL